MLEILFNGKYGGIETAVGVAIAFFIAFVGISVFKNVLPKDQGREFAHNGTLSEGKPRGAGIIMIFAFVISTVVVISLDVEYIAYLLLIFGSMITGYLDDASSTPWSELKKGILDLIISLGAAISYWYYNSSKIVIATLGVDIELPAVVFILLGTILVWVSINVTNCSDGVDGLCGSLTVISLISALILIHKLDCDESFEKILLVMIASILAYLWFNASPSKLLMGDAGSRALGVVLAIAFMKSTAPLMFIPCALIIIIDGGLGLVKLSAIRYLKWKKFMANVRTPIHDHMRKNKKWSDTQTVFRLCILQIIVTVGIMAVVFK
ncbi:MAG: phospho-N-acetylmuramoyl-pentapeptide-transferase [Ruminococcus sp.]|nr:phospho-N-acetylmuramoyl-pentapeptide-transferase [Ruminococcus sp.]